MIEQIDMSDTLNVTVLAPQASPSRRNVNDILLLTKDVPVRNVDVFTKYNDLASVLKDWGDGNVSKFATGVYGQSPNIKSGDGQLIVAPVLANSHADATPFTITFEALFFQPFKDKISGELEINLTEAGGTNTAKLQLDFSTATNLEDIFSIVQAELDAHQTDLGQQLLASFVNGNDLVLTATQVGDDVQDATFAGDLYVDGLFTPSSTKFTRGTAEYNGVERIQDAIVRLSSLLYFGQVAVTYKDKPEAMAASDLVQSMICMFWMFDSDTANFDIVRQKGNYKTRCVYYHDETDFAALGSIISAYCYYNFLTPIGVMRNLFDKSLSVIAPDSIDNTRLNESRAFGYEVYGLQGGVGVLKNNGANQWTDVVYTLNALTIDLQDARFNLNRNNLSVASVNQLYDCYNKIFNKYKGLGFINAGGVEWEGQVPFGDAGEGKQAVFNTGYYLFIDNPNNMSMTAREQRLDPPCGALIKLQTKFNRGQILIQLQF